MASPDEISNTGGPGQFWPDARSLRVDSVSQRIPGFRVCFYFLTAAFFAGTASLAGTASFADGFPVVSTVSALAC